MLKFVQLKIIIPLL